MKVTPGLHPAVNIPSNRVLDSWLDGDHTDWANPHLSSLGILPSGLLNLKFVSALNLDMRQGCLKPCQIQLFEWNKGLIALSSFAHQYQLCSSL